jgi:hypothetical protein
MAGVGVGRKLSHRGTQNVAVARAATYIAVAIAPHHPTYLHLWFLHIERRLKHEEIA